MRYLFLFTLALISISCSTPEKKKLNVLFIIADDLTSTAVSSYENKACKTPNIDMLASGGVRYTQAYCQYPVCGPSRASFMFGYYPNASTTFGYVSGRENVGPDRKSWAQLFKDNGYYTARVSKIYHMGVPGDIEKGSNGTDDEASWTERFNSQGPEWKAPGDGELVQGNPDGTLPIRGGNVMTIVKADGNDLVHSDGKTAKVLRWKKYFKILMEKWFHLFDIFLAPRIIAYAGSVAILLVISLYSITYFSRSNYFYLTEIEPERQITLRTETTASSALTEGLELFADGKYKKAIEEFDTFLKNNPDNYSANYYLGLSFLNTSKEGLPGLPYKFDRQKVNKGIKYLKKALLLSRDNQFYQEDCYWFLGKAYLMIKKSDKAKIQFNKILNLDKINLMRKEDVREMLSVLK